MAEKKSKEIIQKIKIEKVNNEKMIKNVRKGFKLPEKNNKEINIKEKLIQERD